jgi:hypothetical protein
MKRLLLTFGIIAEMTTMMFAQGSAAPAGTPEPLPPGPLLKPIPSQTRWTISRKGGQGGSPEPAKAAPSATPESGQAKSGGKDSAAQFDIQIIGEKVGDVSHVVTTYGNGSKKEVWKKGGVQTTMNTGWQQPIVGPAFEDAEDVTWTSASNFTGIKKVSGLDCMVFRDKILPELYRARPDLLRKSVASSKVEQEGIDQVTKVLGKESTAVDPESVKVDAVAVIDLERRLPIALQLGKVVTTYKYEALPTDYTLTLPADVAAAMQTRGQEVQAATRRPAQP